MGAGFDLLLNLGGFLGCGGIFTASRLPPFSLRSIRLYNGFILRPYETF